VAGTAPGKRRGRPQGKPAARIVTRGSIDGTGGRGRFMPDAEFDAALSALVAAGFSDVEAGERLSLIDTFERKTTRDLLLEDALENVASAGVGEAASSSSAAV
jgi:hypothetical protein